MNSAFDYNEEKLCDDLQKDFNCNIVLNNTAFIQVTLKSDFLLNCLRQLKEKYFFVKLVDVVGVDLSKDSFTDDNEIIFILERMDDCKLLCLKTTLYKDFKFKELLTLWRALDWNLRELYECVGVSLTDEGRKQLLTHDNIEGFFLKKKNPCVFKNQPVYRRNFKIYDVEVPTSNQTKQWFSLGPFHELTNNQFRILMELSEDNVGKSEVEIGYNHIGMEKILENYNFNDSLIFLNKYHVIAKVSFPILWCKTFEEILNVQISDRVKAIRMLYLEMERIEDHLATLFGLMKSTKNDWGTCELKKIIFYFDQYMNKLGIGNFGRCLHQLGGLTRDIERSICLFILENIAHLEKMVQSLEKHLTSSRQWMDRLQTQKINAQMAELYGLEGPNLRACGIKYDLRKNNPYYLYQDVEFDIPLGINGTTYDRYFVRIKEIFESIKIILQILDNVPSGEFSARSYDQKDSLVFPEKKHISRIENSRGSIGIFLIGSGGDAPSRVKIIGPSFKTVSSLNAIIENEKIDNLPVVINSLDINIFEVDR